MTTTAKTLWPIAKTISGARAMIGIVWLAMTYGTRARSSSRTWTKIVASTSPSSAPSDEPDRPPRASVERRAEQELGEVESAPRCHGSPSASDDVPDVGQLQVVGERPAERRVPETGEPGGPPGRATGRRRGTSALPDDEDDDDDRDDDRQCRRTATAGDARAAGGATRRRPRRRAARSAVALVTG